MECEACNKAKDYYKSCLDPDGKLEDLGGQPLLDLLSQFYWNITDFDGGTQLEQWNFQVSSPSIQKLSHSNYPSNFL